LSDVGRIREVLILLMFGMVLVIGGFMIFHSGVNLITGGT
jgi:hypothetical protein